VVATALVLAALAIAPDQPYAPHIAQTQAEATAPAHTIKRNNALIFFSKDAMDAGIALITQGVTDAAQVSQYVACVAHEGDRFATMPHGGGFSYLHIQLTSGTAKGCDGFATIEDLNL
jgi:hypothetical protein